jgi:putative colanic acid biosynthesis UDP-glucose lipid carrier transferase
MNHLPATATIGHLSFRGKGRMSHAGVASEMSPDPMDGAEHFADTHERSSARRLGEASGSEKSPRNANSRLTSGKIGSSQSISRPKDQRASETIGQFDSQESIPRITRQIDSANDVRVKLGTQSLTETLASLIEPTLPALLFLAIAFFLEGAVGAQDVVFASIVFFIFAWRLSTFRGPSRVGLAAVASSWVTASVALLLLGTATGHLATFNPIVLLAWFVAGPLLHAAASRHRDAVMSLFVKLRRPYRIVIVGANDLGVAFARGLHKDVVAHVEVVAFYDERTEKRTATAQFTKVSGSFCDLGRFVRAQAIDYVYLALPMASQPRIIDLLKSLRDTTASVYFIPNVHTLDLIQARVESRAGFPVVAAYEAPFRGVDGALKRTMDVIFASAALVLLAPVILATALAVKISSPGPVIFMQRRFGLDGKEILVYKFRSMTVTENGSDKYVQVVRGDTRVTRVGAFIRKTSLDELPQLLNVMQGRMSLVGPRPHVLSVNEHYRHLIDGYMLRHKVRPGITGWAQVHGYRGGDDLASMRMRVAYDIDYLRRWSLWLDVLILWRTVAVVFRDSKAF